MATLSRAPRGFVVSGEADNKNNGLRQQVEGKGKIHLNSEQKNSSTSTVRTRKYNRAAIISSTLWAAAHQRQKKQPALSSASLQLVVGLRGSIRLNLTFFIGSFEEAQQTGEGQLQPSAKQLTGDLAQQRSLPRCPTLFLAWSLCCSTPPVSPDGLTGIVLVVPIKLFIWLFRRRWRGSVPTLSPGNLCWVVYMHFVIRIALEKDSVMPYKQLSKRGKGSHTY